MNKFQELKKAIKNTPADKLAKVEYQSHFLNMGGVILVSSILIWKGFWWIIFAFIFSLGVSYSQGAGAYQKYQALKPYFKKKKYNPNKDKSFTRKRDYYIKQSLGRYVWIIAALASLYLNLMFVPRGSWWQDIIFSLGFIFWYVVVYFFFFYWIVKWIWWLENDS